MTFVTAWPAESSLRRGKDGHDCAQSAGRLPRAGPLTSTRAVRSGKPVLATCAGMILAACEVLEPAQRSLGLLDVCVRRNAWGRQVDSFEGCSDAGRPLVFIRAPRVERVGRRVEILDSFRGEPIMLRERAITAATFHPELTDSNDVHAQVFGNGCAG